MATSAMTVEGVIIPQIFLVVSHFKPFIPWIPTSSLARCGIPPYAFFVVQHGEFTAYCFYRAIGAVVFTASTFELRVFLETFPLHFFREE
jgi:hypothetical protein